MQVALIATRSLQFWAVAVLFGGAGFALGLHRRDRCVIRTLQTTSVGVALSGLAWFAIVFTTVTGGAASFLDLEAWGDFLSAPFGWPWLARLVFCCLAAGMVLSEALAGFAALGGAFIIDQAWIGHAANGSGFGAAGEIGLYWLHVLAGSAWVGALVMLCVLTISAGRMPQGALVLFSNLGIFVVAAIVASGVANAWLRGVGLADLFSTAYGRLLAAKLVVVAAMLCLAGFNRFARTRPVDDGLLRASVSLETVFGLIVIGVAATLGVTAPP